LLNSGTNFGTNSGLAGKTAYSKLVMVVLAFLFCALPARADQLAIDLANWESLTRPDSAAGFETYAAFILAHPDWPRMNTLREAAERRATPGPTAKVYFDTNPPRTIHGVRAYMRSGGNQDRLDEVWLEKLPTPSDQSAFLDEFRSSLSSGDIFARASRLVWDGEFENARALATRLEAGHRSVIQARIALRNGNGNADALLSGIPASLQNDPGLVHDRVRWRNRNDNESGAIALLRQYPGISGGDDDAWWKQRDSLAHWALEHGNSQTAYEIAAHHGFAQGVPLMEAEWLAGWIALRYLGDPHKAITHFARMNTAAVSIISKARGSYWLGRAAEALGEREKANGWYDVAAAYGTTFYGQIAALDRYGEVNISAPGEMRVSETDKAAFGRRELVRLVRLVAQRGDRDLTGLFFRALIDTIASQSDATLTIRLAGELGRKDMATWAAKNAGRKGFVTGREGYPVMHGLPGSPGASVIHAIIRQESGFDAGARSPAGALGLMQLMPGTANLVARKIGIRVNASQLTSNPQTNLRLGSWLLNDHLEDYSGSLVMAAIAYNAGPGRASDWTDRFGDPRSPAPPVRARLKGWREGEPRHWLALDVIESYPFSETRFYIQQVLANAEVYRAVLNSNGQSRLGIQKALTGCENC